MKKILLSIALAAICAFAASAPKTHDGFFLNATMGAGYSSFEDKIEGGLGKITCDGGAFEASFKLGGTTLATPFTQTSNSKPGATKSLLNTTVSTCLCSAAV